MMRAQLISDPEDPTPTVALLSAEDCVLIQGRWWI